MTKQAAILGVVNALLALLIAFGTDITQDQQVAITAAVNAVLIAGAAFFDPAVPFGKTNGNS